MTDRDRVAARPRPPDEPDAKRAPAAPHDAPQRARFDALADEDPQICRGID